MMRKRKVDKPPMTREAFEQKRELALAKAEKAKADELKAQQAAIVQEQQAKLLAE